jgi:hypothetical protein
MTRSFDVTYKMEIEADDPLDAARQMYETMRTEPGPYLELRDADTGEEFTVDLEAQEPRAERKA